MPQIESVESLSQEDVSVCRLLLEIARAVVQDGDSFTVDIAEEDGLHTLHVRADSDGFGRLVGSQGRTVRAIRTILGAASMKMRQTYSLDIRERVK